MLPLYILKYDKIFLIFLSRNFKVDSFLKYLKFNNIFLKTRYVDIRHLLFDGEIPILLVMSHCLIKIGYHKIP